MKVADLIDESVLTDARKVDDFVKEHGERQPSIENTLRLVRDIDTDGLRRIGKDVWGTGGEGNDLIGRSFDDCLAELDKASTNAAAWTGNAKNAYSERLTRTKNAINGMRGPAEDVGKSLVAIADAWDEKFGHSLADILTIIGVIVAIIGVIVAIATGWTGVGAVIGLVVAVIGLIVAVASYLVAEHDKEQAKIDSLHDAGREATETMEAAKKTKP